MVWTSHKILLKLFVFLHFLIFSYQRRSDFARTCWMFTCAHVEVPVVRHHVILCGFSRLIRNNSEYSVDKLGYHYVGGLTRSDQKSEWYTRNNKLIFIDLNEAMVGTILTRYWKVFWELVLNVEKYQMNWHSFTFFLSYCWKDNYSLHYIWNINLIIEP